MTDLMLRTSGTSSIHEDHPFQRLWRDTRTTTLRRQINIETYYEELGRADVGLTGAARNA
ncbi:hypothetical protein [Paraburkholderia sediminicola]|uniref:hypothetical protein n=2 Tax=Paraburkholderia TaxID=1822464 RepID=UPI0038B8B2AB